MTLRKIIGPAALAGLLALGGALAPAPAAAQSYDRESHGRDRAEMFGRGDRGWFEGRPEVFGQGRRGWFEERDRYARDQYERGYRRGRDDERNRYANEERNRQGRDQGGYGRGGYGGRNYGSGYGERRERDEGWFSGDGLFD